MHEHWSLATIHLFTKALIRDKSLWDSKDAKMEEGSNNKKSASQVHILKKDEGESSTGRKPERSTIC